MLLHPEMLMSQYRNRRRDLVAEADLAHLLAVARRRRRARRGAHAQAGTGPTVP